MVVGELIVCNDAYQSCAYHSIVVILRTHFTLSCTIRVCCDILIVAVALSLYINLCTILFVSTNLNPRQ